MIHSLRLRNFQSHKASELEFGPGVNVIIGSSDSGKTAIFRAFRWLMYNRPLGSSFRSTWGGTTRVITQLTDGHSITRWKDDSSQGYIVNKQKLTAIKTDVPEEVSKILQMSDINFQQQFDRPFLLDESPGNVAAHFTKIAKLGSIGTVISNLTREERELKRKQQTNDQNIQEAQNELKQYDWIDEAEKLVATVETLDASRIVKQEEKLHLQTLVGNWKQLDQQEVQLQTTLELEPLLKSVQKAIQLRDAAKAQYQELREKIQQLQQWNRELKDVHGLLQLEQWTTKADEKLTKCNTVRNDVKDLQDLISQIRLEERKLAQARTLADQLQRQFDSAFPDVCPLCGSRKEGKR